MIKSLISLIVGTILMVSFIIPVYAIVDPLARTNNIHGIHIVDENDLEEASKLVNSNGGEWGYVTMVIQESDRDEGKWQQTFDKMRRLKIIPVIRLATRPLGPVWKKPLESDAHAWADFLDKLNWVVQNRYVILFNEPNHANEWGGELRPDEYARIARVFHDELRRRSADYFMLPAGFDQAAGNTENTMDATSYFQQMHEADDQIFTLFDGWSVHAYPNPNFSGSPYATGRRSIRGFEWEVSYLTSFGLPADTPVFITETGWAHREGRNGDNRSFQTADIVASNYQHAYEEVWNQKNIVMVSPFLFNYQDSPFDHFSWQRPNAADFFPQYETVKNLVKVQGSPAQIEKGDLVLSRIPDTLTVDSVFFLPIGIKNTGQTIWDEHNSVQLKVLGTQPSEEVIPVQTPHLEPFHEKIVKVTVRTPEEEGYIPFFVRLEKDGKQLGDVVEKRIKVEYPKSVWGKTVFFIRKFFEKQSSHR